MPDFATHLRQLRVRQGISKYRLAQLSGVTKEGIGKLETPGSNPRLETLCKLAAALGVTPRDMIPEQKEAALKPKPTAKRKK
jgi:transcriptional regulator with XRE-family HTH domain